MLSLGISPHPEPTVHLVSDRRRASYRPSYRPLAARVEDLLERDGAHQRHLRKVRRRQRTLQRRVSHVGWRAYLELEEAEFDRWTHAIDRVARWALARGRRERGQR